MSYGTSGGSGRLKKGRSPYVVLAAMASAGIALGVGIVGCGNGKKPTDGDPRPATPSSSAAPAKTAPVAKASASASASAALSASASSSAAAPPVPAEPQGTGVAGFVAAGQTDACKVQMSQVADYLQRGEVSLAGHDGAFAAAWLIKLSPGRADAQLAFAGFSLDAKQVARARGVGTSNELAPRLFSSGPGWTLVWFDSEGLAYAKPRWETSPQPPTEHLRAVGSADAEHVSLAGTPTGAIIAVAPFGADKSQFGMFLFAPLEPDAPAVQALGATHHAKKPRWPAVIADAGGYTLAWHEEGDQIVVSRFDLKGRELGEAVTLAAAAQGRGRVVLASTAKGAVAMWSEGDKLLARALDAEAHPAPETWVVGYGKTPSLASFGEGALALFTGQDGTASNQVLAVKLGPNGAPSPKGIRVTDTGPAKDPPATVVVGSRVGFLWTEPMTQGVGSKRALLRTIEAACIP
jgi:hypothetical protein